MKYEMKKIEDIAYVTMGQSPLSKFYNKNGKGIEFLQGVRTFGRMYPTFDTFTTSFNKSSEKNDILLSVRAPVGEVNLSPRKIAIGRGLASLSPKNNIDNIYLYYLILSIGKKMNYSSNGTIFNSINKNDILKTEVKVCVDKKSQYDIAKKLFDIDKKISLNTEINKNLDELMKIFFYEHVINNNDIQKSFLDNIANFKNGISISKFKPRLNEKDFPVLKIRELNQGFTDSSSDLCNDDISEDVIVSTGDVIFSWSGTLLVKVWSGEKCVLNQHLFKVTSDSYPKWFIYEWTKYHLKRFKSIARDKATTMGNIRRSDLKESEVQIPTDEDMKKLGDIMQPIFDKYVNNIKQNTRLKELKEILMNKFFN